LISPVFCVMGLQSASSVAVWAVTLQPRTCKVHVGAADDMTAEMQQQSEYLCAPAAGSWATPYASRYSKRQGYYARYATGNADISAAPIKPAMRQPIADSP
jgi:hypothetical protein